MLQLMLMHWCYYVENALNLVKICVSFVFLVVGSFPAKRHLKSHPKGYHWKPPLEPFTPPTGWKSSWSDTDFWHFTQFLRYFFPILSFFSKEIKFFSNEIQISSNEIKIFPMKSKSPSPTEQSCVHHCFLDFYKAIFTEY